MRVLIASKNVGKIREFQKLLHNIELVSWPIDAPDIPEHGAFFQDNAMQKATFAHEWALRHYMDQTIDGTLADDSGLCVDALWGGPGVLSARFAKNLSQHDKNRLLLSKMPIGEPRSARFVCVLAWIPNMGQPKIFTGTTEGTLAQVPMGTKGFGYDPIFIPNGFRDTLGELPEETKNKISHRNKASQVFLTEMININKNLIVVNK